jgi:hypothetical protein
LNYAWNILKRRPLDVVTYEESSVAFSFLFGITGHSWPSPIVMHLSISDPLQTTVPGSVITYHFELVNTIGTDLPILGLVNLAPQHIYPR